MTDDRHLPHRATNTLMLHQNGDPAPRAVLAAVLQATGGITPTYLAALPTSEEGSTTWLVFGCTEQVLFMLDARKEIERWRGGGADHRGASLGTTLALNVVALSVIDQAAFTLDEVWNEDLGGLPALHGQWTFSSRGREVATVPTLGMNTQHNEQLGGVVATVLTSLR